MWAKLKAFFKNSETIVWARLQMLGGAMLAVFSSMNLTTFLDDTLSKSKQLMLFGVLFFQGVITEFARRLRADFDPPPAVPAPPIVPAPPAPPAA